MKMKLINKKARFKYEFLETYLCGICLLGSEIKSVRESKVIFTDSYCLFIDNELWLRSLHISEYKDATYLNHEPKRDRKLLLTKKELKKIKIMVSEKGLTIVPTSIFINEHNLCKIEIAIARGKKEYDHRETIKKRDSERERKND